MAEEKKTKKLSIFLRIVIALLIILVLIVGVAFFYVKGQMLEMKVNLQLWVKVRKEWRDSDLLLKNYGYNEKQQ